MSFILFFFYLSFLFTFYLLTFPLKGAEWREGKESSQPQKQGIKVAITFSSTLRIKRATVILWHFRCLPKKWPGENPSLLSDYRKEGSSSFGPYRWPPAAASILTDSSWNASFSTMWTGCLSCCWSLEQTTRLGFKSAQGDAVVGALEVDTHWRPRRFASTRFSPTQRGRWSRTPTRRRGRKTRSRFPLKTKSKV